MLTTFVSLLLSLVAGAVAGTVTYDWSIDWVTAVPDGFSRQVIRINGQWPCPLIEATVGDIAVVVNVYKISDRSQEGFISIELIRRVPWLWMDRVELLNVQFLQDHTSSTAFR